MIEIAFFQPQMNADERGYGRERSHPKIPKPKRIIEELEIITPSGSKAITIKPPNTRRK